MHEAVMDGEFKSWDTRGVLDLATDDTRFGSLPTHHSLQDVGSQWHLENSGSQRDSSPERNIEKVNNNGAGQNSACKVLLY